MANIRNGHKPERPQTYMSTDQNGHKPKLSKATCCLFAIRKRSLWA